MAFWINNNEKVAETWKWVNETLKVVGTLVWVLNFLVRLRDNANNWESNLQLITQWIVITLFSCFIILNFIHWLRPIWFEEKVENEK